MLWQCYKSQLEYQNGDSTRRPHTDRDASPAPPQRIHGESHEVADLFRRQMAMARELGVAGDLDGLAPEMLAASLTKEGLPFSPNGIPVAGR